MVPGTREPASATASSDAEALTGLVSGLFVVTLGLLLFRWGPNVWAYQRQCLGRPYEIKRYDVWVSRIAGTCLVAGGAVLIVAGFLGELPPVESGPHG